MNGKKENSRRLAVFLLLLSAFAGILLAATNSMTKESILAQKTAEINTSLNAVLPQADQFAYLTTEASGTMVYQGTKAGRGVGCAAIVYPNGYNGPITLAVGINLKNEISGIKVIHLSETPGLGDKVKSAGFLNQFINKGSKDPLVPKQDIQAITGATISTRAICSGVRLALDTVLSRR